MPSIDASDAEWFPDGRTLFYEGEHPDAFVEDIKQRCGFDPSTSRGQMSIPGAFMLHRPPPAEVVVHPGQVVTDDGWVATPDRLAAFAPLPKWGEVGEGDDARACYAFHCPPEHIKAVFNGRWPIGT